MIMEEQDKSLKEYLHILVRRKYMIVGPMMVMFVLSAIVALALPAIYRSEATILIEQQHIPPDLVKSTVVSFADERIKEIQQKLMTVDNVTKVIEKFNLYPSEQKSASPFVLAEQFMENTELELVNAEVIGRGKTTKATLAFKLSFNDQNAQLAQKVANELVTLFLDENVKSRTQRAEETTEFLEEESEKFKREIQKLESQLAEYKEKYTNSLPEMLPANVASIGRVEAQLQQLQLQEKMVGERRISLRTQLAVTSPNVVTIETKDKPVETLESLEGEYKSLMEKYSELHPQVKALKRKIDSFDKTKQPASEASKKLSATNPVYLQLQSEIDIADIEAKNIAEERKSLNEKLSQLELSISQTHQVERGYEDMMRDLENQKAKYKELKAKSLEAKLSQTLEEEQKGEKFSLLEPPRVPEKPEKPNRIKIMFIGFIFSIVGGLACGYAAEMFDGSVRGYKQLASLTGIEPLVVIPYIKNDEDTKKGRNHLRNFVLLGAFLAVSLLVSIHMLYMPLDVIILKMWNKIARI